MWGLELHWSLVSYNKNNNDNNNNNDETVKCNLIRFMISVIILEQRRCTLNEHRNKFCMENSKEHIRKILHLCWLKQLREPRLAPSCVGYTHVKPFRHFSTGERQRQRYEACSVQLPGATCITLTATGLGRSRSIRTPQPTIFGPWDKSCRARMLKEYMQLDECQKYQVWSALCWTDHPSVMVSILASHSCGPGFSSLFSANLSSFYLATLS
jgi:hypothetical protein